MAEAIEVVFAMPLYDAAKDLATPGPGSVRIARPLTIIDSPFLPARRILVREIPGVSAGQCNSAVWALQAWASDIQMVPSVLLAPGFSIQHISCVLSYGM